MNPSRPIQIQFRASPAKLMRNWINTLNDEQLNGAIKSCLIDWSTEELEEDYEIEVTSPPVTESRSGLTYDQAATLITALTNESKQ